MKSPGHIANTYSSAPAERRRIGPVRHASLLKQGNVVPIKEKWSCKERDSNSRYNCSHNGFRNRPIQPIRHLPAGLRLF